MNLARQRSTFSGQQGRLQALGLTALLIPERALGASGPSGRRPIRFLLGAHDIDAFSAEMANLDWVLDAARSST